MVEGKTLSTFRDIVVIVGILVLCLCEMQAFAFRVQGRREQSARFALARNAVTQLDQAYKRMITDKSLNEQIFRQNEILIEYDKLLLTMPYVPVPVRTSQAPAAPAPTVPAPSGPKAP